MHGSKKSKILICFWDSLISLDGYVTFFGIKFDLSKSNPTAHSTQENLTEF